jgi:hypothetical protein
MAITVLTFIASEEEISSGIPRSITIEANIPSTIYYTLDGTTPTINSPIYIEPIEIPTGINSIILSAFGVDNTDEMGSILTQFFAPDTTRITVSRNVGAEGFVIDRFNFGEDNSTGFDADGSQARFVDVDPSTLNIIHSTRGFEGLTGGVAIEVNIPAPFETPSLLDDNFQPFSTPEQAELFNPYAKMILIDNRVDNDIQLMPRPYGSLNDVYREFGGKRIRSAASDACYISGGFVRRFYDAARNVMVSYYFDHNESRYVKNIQELPNNIPNVYFSNMTGMPLIFRWIERGKQSSY